MTTIDAHVHVFSTASDRYPREVTSLFPADRSGSVESLLREMDGAQIERAVLIQLGGYGTEHHRYVAEAIRGWPDRLAGVGLIDLSDPDPPARLVELREATGVRGIRLMGPLGDPLAASAQEPPAFSLLQRAGELGINVNLYCPSDQIGNIERVVGALPGVTFSLDHLGICPETAPHVDRWRRPHFADEPIPPATYGRVLGLAQYPNVYIKLSGEYAFSKMPYPFADVSPMVIQAFEAFGPQRLMWCSDFPWICEEPGYTLLADLVDHHLPRISRDDRALIMGGNALRVWFSG